MIKFSYIIRYVKIGEDGTEKYHMTTASEENINEHLRSIFMNGGSDVEVHVASSWLEVEK